MKHLLLVTLFALGLSAQTFNDFSPKVKGVTIGPVHCYFWSLVGQYDAEIACYINNVLQQIQAKVPTGTLLGSFIYPKLPVVPPQEIGGIISWIINYEVGNPLMHCQVAAQPTGGVQFFKEWYF